MVALIGQPRCNLRKHQHIEKSCKSFKKAHKHNESYWKKQKPAPIAFYLNFAVFYVLVFS